MMSSDALATLRDRKPDMSINGEAMIRLQSRSSAVDVLSGPEGAA